MAAGYHSRPGIAHSNRKSGTRSPLGPQAAPDSVGKAKDHDGHLVNIGETPAERLLTTNTPRAPAPLDEAGIVVPRQGPERTGSSQPEHWREGIRSDFGEFADGADPETVQSLGRHLAHTPEGLDREWVQEVEFGALLDDHQPVGLGARAEAILARNLVEATPMLRGKPTSSLTRRLNSRAMSEG